MFKRIVRLLVPGVVLLQTTCDFAALNLLNTLEFTYLETGSIGFGSDSDDGTEWYCWPFDC